MKIMLIEDDYVLNKGITLYFSKKGYRVDSFLNGLDAYDNLLNTYDIFIVDIDVPEMNGIELLQKIKETFSNAYILMISATIDIEMIEKAYNLGCNDYIKKPFSTKEIELKLNLLKEKINTKYQFTKNSFYDLNKSQIILENETIKLTKKESDLLYLLLNNKGNIVTLEQIIDTVWNGDGLTSHIRKLVSRLNKKLPASIITNRTGIGYIIE